MAAAHQEHLAAHQAHLENAQRSRDIAHLHHRSIESALIGDSDSLEMQQAEEKAFDEKHRLKHYRLKAEHESEAMMTRLSRPRADLLGPAAEARVAQAAHDHGVGSQEHKIALHLGENLALPAHSGKADQTLPLFTSSQGIERCLQSSSDS